MCVMLLLSFCGLLLLQRAAGRKSFHDTANSLRPSPIPSPTVSPNSLSGSTARYCLKYCVQLVRHHKLYDALSQ